MLRLKISSVVQRPDRKLVCSSAICLSLLLSSVSYDFHLDPSWVVTEAYRALILVLMHVVFLWEDADQRTSSQSGTFSALPDLVAYCV